MPAWMKGASLAYDKGRETLEIVFPSGHSTLYPNVNARMLGRILSGKPEKIQRKIDKMLGGIQIRRKAK